jgi:hypothetical protein
MTTAADVSETLTRLVNLSGDPTMHNYYAFIAFELAADRAREASQYRLAAAARENRSARRSLAVGLAAIGRVVAGLVRRLDACVADEFAASIRPDLVTNR